MRLAGHVELLVRAFTTGISRRRQRLAAGSKARQGPQTERRAKSWSRCIGCPSRKPSSCYNKMMSRPSVNNRANLLQLTTRVLNGVAPRSCSRNLIASGTAPRLPDIAPPEVTSGVRSKLPCVRGAGHCAAKSPKRRL